MIESEQELHHHRQHHHHHQHHHLHHHAMESQQQTIVDTSSSISTSSISSSSSSSINSSSSSSTTVVSFPADSSDKEEVGDCENGDLEQLLKIKKRSFESMAIVGDTLRPLPDRFFIRQSDRFISMSFLDILREATCLLRANTSLLMSIMFLLICPVSTLLLSRSFLLHSHLPRRLAARLYSMASAAGFLHSSLNTSIFSSLAHTFLSYIFCSPALFTIWLLAKAAVMFTVACTYAGKKPSFPMFLPVASKLWKRLVYTYIWICLVVLGCGSVAVFLLLLVISILDALEISADLVFLTEMAMALCYSVILAQMMVIGNLANVVSILEEHYGLTALVRSLHLIKGRTQVALSLLLFTMIGTAMVESLYQYRVIGTPNSTYPVNTASRLWEGPLLVLMYSFLFLYDAIVSCVFYFTCKSAVSTSSDKQAVWEHISIGLDLVDL